MVNYFEVLYSNCFGKRCVAIVATLHASPEIPTTVFNFNWNGNRLIEFRETDRHSYQTNTYRFYK